MPEPDRIYTEWEGTVISQLTELNVLLRGVHERLDKLNGTVGKHERQLCDLTTKYRVTVGVAAVLGVIGGALLRIMEVLMPHGGK